MLLMARGANAQQRGVIHDSLVVRDTQNLFAMDQSAARPVRLPPKPNAVRLLTADQRDELEHRIHCQCGCTLSVYICRTTDFSCRVSPAMHRDVVALVEGGYSAQEIIDAFVDTYGETALMAPKKSGFNLVGWLTPGIAVLVAGGLVLQLLRRWGRNRDQQMAAATPLNVDGTPEELARLEAAVKGDDAP